MKMLFLAASLTLGLSLVSATNANACKLSFAQASRMSYGYYFAMNSNADIKIAIQQAYLRKISRYDQAIKVCQKYAPNTRQYPALSTICNDILWAYIDGIYYNMSLGCKK